MEEVMIKKLSLWLSLVITAVFGTIFVLLSISLLWGLFPGLKGDPVKVVVLGVVLMGSLSVSLFNGAWYSLTRQELERKVEQKEPATGKKITPQPPSIDLESIGLRWSIGGLTTGYQIQLWANLKAEIERQVAYKLKLGDTPDYPTMASIIVNRTGLAAFLSSEVRRAVEETLTRFLAVQDNDMALRFVQAVVGNL